MKPVLFPADATAFTSNGLGRLDPTECIVTEERNGQYELMCVVPVDSPHFGDIANNMILAVVPGDGGSVHPKDTMQAFRIYMITEPLNGLVTLYARHISYDLSYNTVMPCTASSVAAALSALSTYAVETCPFTFTTDKSTVANWRVDRPQTVRSELGGQRGSILDVYGGEYDWDNFKVKLWNQRGTDTDVTLRYGKNITDISQEQNLENVITGIVPFWMNDTTLVTLTEKSVDSAYASQYPFNRTVPVDFSSEWDTAPTESQLRSKAQSYITANKIGIPKVSIEVSFVALWQTEEYKDIAPLERVHLCDTVGVVFEKYGISTRAEVIKTEWDCLAERYLSIELGEARSRFASTLVEMNQQTTQEIAEAKTELQNAIDAATSAITGTNGGYLKINSNSDGQPYELLIMDTPDISTATKIWRWNLGGLGYSSTGYAGTFGTAITMNGAIVADYITAGTMSANRIRTGLLESTAKKPGTQTPVSSWNLDTGKLVTSDGDFTGTISGSTITGSTITSTNGTKTTTISGGTITTNDLRASSGSFSGTITASTITGSSITSTSGSKSTTINGGSISTNDINVTGGKISMDSDNYWDLTQKKFNLEMSSDGYKSCMYMDASYFQIYHADSDANVADNYWFLNSGEFRIGAPGANAPHILLGGNTAGASFEIYHDANNYWDLKTGVFKTNNGTFTGSISASDITGGTITGSTYVSVEEVTISDDPIYTTPYTQYRKITIEPGKVSFAVKDRRTSGVYHTCGIIQAAASKETDFQSCFAIVHPTSGPRSAIAIDNGQIFLGDIYRGFEPDDSSYVNPGSILRVTANNGIYMSANGGPLDLSGGGRDILLRFSQFEDLKIYENDTFYYGYTGNVTINGTTLEIMHGIITDIT